MAETLAWLLATVVFLGLVYVVVRAAVISGMREALSGRKVPERVHDGRDKPLKL
jgi:hypothetical protein